MYLLEENIDAWTLKHLDYTFIEEQRQQVWLDFALKILSYRNFAKFTSISMCEPSIIRYVVDQLEVPDRFARIEKRGIHTERLRRKAVFEYLGIESIDSHAKDLLREHLELDPNNAVLSRDEIATVARTWCQERHLTLPDKKWLDRVFQALRGKVDDAIFQEIFSNLNPAARDRMLASIKEQGSGPSLSDFRSGAGRVGLKAFETLAARLRYIQSLEIDKLTLGGTPRNWREDASRRLASLPPSDISRMPPSRQIGLYAVYLYELLPDLIDALIEALVKAVNKFERHAENSVKGAITANIETVYDRERLLASIAAGWLEYREGGAPMTVDQFMLQFMDVSEAQALASKSGKSTWAQDMFEKMRGSWTNHYRSMLKEVLELLEFHTNYSVFEPLLGGLDWVHVNWDRRISVYPMREGVPVEGVVPKKYMDGVIKANGCLNRHAYELCLVLELGKKIDRKAVWVPGSRKYDDPDKDIPQDFEEKRDVYYGQLNLTQDAKAFVGALKEELTEQLQALNDELPGNPFVEIQDHIENPKIKIARLKALPEPQNLKAVKSELVSRWDMVGLPDMLKEAALDTRFLREFQTAGYYHNLSRPVLDMRLILCIYALGTNIGIKRLAAATNLATERELEHVRNRFIDSKSLKRANALLVNAILGIRDTSIWGPVGTACASDSQHFGAWDANPLAEMHQRYKQAGIMAYTHTEGKSVCIYTQGTAVASLEYASMIRGLLQHGTEMEIERQYADSHGQTEVAFAFSHMLGVDLAPRIKRLSHMKLFLPDTAIKHRLPNLSGILGARLNDAEIVKHYDEIVQYTAAMKTLTADPETILRRFKRSGVRHPVYRAVQELGRAVKTIFACRYLRSEPFRREIQEGLNVMENWHSATKFVGFGRGGEISTNRREDQEVAIQALHLLQNCMVYVNTQMYQSVLAEPTWRAKMQAEDYRGITPLIYAHVNPYGRYDLDLDTRLMF